MSIEICKTELSDYQHRNTQSLKTYTDMTNSAIIVYTLVTTACLVFC